MASNRPLTSIELHDRMERVDADGEVPEELRALWSDLSTIYEPPEVTIEKGVGELVELSPKRPSWVASAITPLMAPPPPPRPLLHHRDRPVDPLIIFLPENRRGYDDTRYPWVLACKIFPGGGGNGSGVIVGPRHVLTASHVVNWGGTAETIEVHRAGGIVQATARTVRRWAFTKITGSVTSHNVDEDYAVLVTDQRIGDRFGWMGVREYDSGWDDETWWRNIGYPPDIAGGSFPAYQRDRWLDEDEWDFGSGRGMNTDADLTPGNSGGPMFAFWDDGPYVVAVASAEDKEESDNWCAGGSDKPRLVNKVRSSNP